MLTIINGLPLSWEKHTQTHSTASSPSNFLRTFDDVYYVHQTNHFNASSIPLDRKYHKNVTDAWGRKVVLGGEPLPSQPIMDVSDINGNNILDDSDNLVVTSFLNPNTNSSCNGSVVDGTNRIQILTCKTKNINESFALSFLGEVSPQIFGTDGEIAILSSLTNLSSVKDADVKLFRKVLSHYNNEEIVQYESATRRFYRCIVL